MHILLRFFDAAEVRRRILLAQSTIEQWADDGARAVFQRQGGLRLSDLKSAEIGRLARALEIRLGLVCDLSKCSARTQKPNGDYQIPWHQDRAAMDAENGMVAWVPLDPLDGTRPSLEIAPEEAAAWEHYRDERRFLVSDRVPSGPSAILSGLEPGDVVLFSPLAPHRTWCEPGMVNTRLSLDMRFR